MKSCAPARACSSSVSARAPRCPSAVSAVACAWDRSGNPPPLASMRCVWRRGTAARLAVRPCAACSQGRFRWAVCDRRPSGLRRASRIIGVPINRNDGYRAWLDRCRSCEYADVIPAGLRPAGRLNQNNTDLGIRSQFTVGVARSSRLARSSHPPEIFQNLPRALLGRVLI